MKGNVKIMVEIKDETGRFPITEACIISRDNTYETIEEWIDVFKRILLFQGFHSETIKEAFSEEK